MRYFSAMNEMNAAMLERLMDFANQNSNEDWTIMLNTSGGGFFSTESIAKIINDHANTTIIVQGAYSSGFMLLHLVRCKIILSKGARGMWHYGKWSVEVNDKAKPYYLEDEAIFGNLPIFRRLSEKIAKDSMTAAELKKFRKDQDIYFSPKRMREIFPHAEVLK